MRAPSWQSSLPLLGRILFVAGLLGCVVLTADLAVTLVRAPATPPVLSIALGALAYLFGHLTRVARLALLNGDAGTSLRRLTGIHFFTSSVALAAPFKLGDAFRMAELSHLTRDAARGVILVWLERVFDVVVILMVLGVAAVTRPAAAASFQGVLVASLAFVGATIVLVALLPDNLRRIGSYIVRRHRAEWSVAILRLISEARNGAARMSGMLRGRQLTLLVFTLVIWAFEGLSFGLIVSSGQNVIQPLAGLLSFLSLITQGETLATFLERWRAFTIPEALFVYVVATQGVLLLTGLAFGVTLAKGRMARRGS